MEIDIKILSFVVGVPGLLILIGFVVYMTGTTLKPLVGEGMAVDGVSFILIGVVIYIVEIILYYVSQSE